MTFPITVLLLLAGAAALLSGGCVTKAKARAEAEAAFRAGEQAGFTKVMRARGPTVTVLGEVREPFVPWTEELTLARAIVLAGYGAQGDPREIVIVRAGQETRIDPARLLRGEDIPLDAGDIIRIVR